MSSPLLSSLTNRAELFGRIGKLGKGESLTFSLPSGRHTRALRTMLYTRHKGEFRISTDGLKVTVIRLQEKQARAAYGSVKANIIRQAIQTAIDLGLVSRVKDATPDNAKVTANEDS